MNTAQTQSTLAPKERALIALVAYLALDRGGEDLQCTLGTAKKEGFSDSEVARIKDYVEGLKVGAQAEEESLSSLLAKATKSTCCS